MLYLRVFSTDILSKSNHCLLLLVLFHDLEVTLHYSVNYICLIYKLKFLVWICSQFWAIFMTDLQPLYLELHFLVPFGDCGNLFFLTKKFWWYYIYVFFLFKNSITSSIKISTSQEWLVAESRQTLHWETFLIFYWLVYDIPSHLNDLILAWSTFLQLC